MWRVRSNGEQIIMAGSPIGPPVGSVVGPPVASPGGIPFLPSGPAAAVATFIANFISGSATPTKGIGTYTYSRLLTTETITDFEGLVKSTLADEIGCDGQRRVETLCNDAGWSVFTAATINVLSGSGTSQEVEVVGLGSPFFAGSILYSLHIGSYDKVELNYSFEMMALNPTDVGKSVRVSIVESSGPGFLNANLDVELTATYTRYSANPSNLGPSIDPSIFISAGILGVSATQCLLKNLLVESTKGHIDAPNVPSEYVSNGGGDDHGVNVDGVKSFPVKNGNTINTNDIVTESTGAIISTPAINKGVNAWEARTNYFLNSAAPVTQAAMVTAGAVVHVVAITGDWTLTVDGVAKADGDTFTPGATANVVITGGATGTVDIQAGSFKSPYIITAGAAATRNEDDHTYDSGNYAEVGWCLADFWVTQDQLDNNANTPTVFELTSTAGTEFLIVEISAASSIRLVTDGSSGSATATFSGITPGQHKIACTWDRAAPNMRASIDGAASVSVTTTATHIMQTADPDEFNIGFSQTAGVEAWNGSILEIQLGNTFIDDSELESIST